MKNIIYFTLALIVVSCADLVDTYPPDRLSPQTAFNTSNDLQLYTNSFYNILPNGNNIVRGDALSDFLVGKDPHQFISGSFSSSQAGGWNWGALRNINYFLEHFEQADITELELNHFEGLARFFRAWFYFEKVKQFGDVPWYDKTLDVGDEDLYKPRDSRELVMENILNDLDYAVEHLFSDTDEFSSKINRWVALAFKSRVCLFEGTFRKYHPDLGLWNSSDFWLEQAAEAAEEIMNNSPFQINIESDLEMSYRNLFINENPNNTEIMLAYVASQDLRVFHDANWYWTSATYGGRYSFTKSFINTYLNNDGSRFTDQSNFNEIPFWEEVKERDLRLQQTIRMGNYQREGESAPPAFSYTYTGYHPLKFTLDSRATDGVSENNNSLPIVRYAEVLLNFAEAKAELNDLGSDDWNRTISILRERAGIQNTLLPTTADEYLIATYFPDISDPILLEVRRERGVELAMEGFRFDDLRRWRAGNLLEKQKDGMYVPEMDTPYDLNEDGQPNVAFVTESPTDPISGVYYFIIDEQEHQLTEQSSGNLIVLDNFTRIFEDHQYFYPIPHDEIVLNPALDQNPGW